MSKEPLIVATYLDKAVDAGFPSTIKSDEFASLGVQLRTHQTRESRGGAGVDQISFSFLGLFNVLANLLPCEFRNMLIIHAHGKIHHQ